MSDIGHRTFVINDINNKKEIIRTLANLYTDEDFNGNNKEYTCENAIEKGFNSNQEYIINDLENDNKLSGIDLIKEFFDEWLGNDGYYTNYKFDYFTHNKETVITVIYEEGY